MTHTLSKYNKLTKNKRQNMSHDYKIDTKMTSCVSKILENKTHISKIAEYKSDDKCFLMIRIQN